MQNTKVTAELLEQAGWTETQINRYYKLRTRKIQHGLEALSVNDRRFYKSATVACANAEKVRIAELRAATQRRVGGKTPVETKLHYRWVAAELEVAREMIDVTPGEISALVIVLDEYLKALDKYQPVLDQIDTSKRHKFYPVEGEMLAIAGVEGYVASFDRVSFKLQLRERFAQHWNPNWDARYDDTGAYENAIIPDTFENEFRGYVRENMERLVREVFPSVKVAV